MSKMSELEMAITELRDAAAAIKNAADSLFEMFSTTAEPKPGAEEKQPTMTLPEVRAILAEKSRAGFTAEIKGLLLKHGADKLSVIDPSEYSSLVADVEELTDAT